MKANIGLIGLAVMGQNLVLNMNDHGFKVAVYNRTTSKVDEFLEGPAQGSQVVGTYSLRELVDSLETPRKVMLMVKAGSVVDQYIEDLLPLLSPGDIIIDGGNSLFTDTDRRTAYLTEKGLLYIGTGVSGGEEGARHGPSIMPGGNKAAWPTVKPIFQAISAHVDGDPCCEWVGDNGAGHYVKMVHNGIEYGDMQLICEAYQLLSEGLGLSTDEMQAIFAEWNQGELSSYLIEITANILAYKEDNGQPLLHSILDTAGQKGTGKWTGINALDLGIPLTLIGESVFARCLSAQKDERVRAAKVLPKPAASFSGDKPAMIEAIRQALYASKIISYAQGFRLMREAAKEYKVSLNYGDIALMWRGGCIIRSQFLNDIKQAYSKNPDLENLLLADFFIDAMKQAEAGWRRAVILGIQLGIPTPAFSSALAYFDGYRSERLPANLLQAQRDYFGAHSYERIDKPRGEFFHTDWTGHGGKTASSTYTV
ncbi:decarboxylating NADP(+)-dependent phosphogluconate dehydrogenase [Methylomonas sp. SURF-2]|uniref:6-phosphogluconate dehydrogenase, decarboxylating n=1 Tax=Methylomonas subterranea TaxID=2952225 RepID=A0ABT1TKS7_9GAMM|nr:decarboxylating NADP(+)-dependent phosphogluconate dehydrogenase [Methylomonas sp. SURF-2]MCQ8106055.1 decarboxylating NADP(+)-dependent phosphogluconate dehydrogenase [Methylomonas sp. SURF-2]